MIQWALAAILWVTLAITQPAAARQEVQDHEYLPIFEQIRSAFSNTNIGLSSDSSALVAGLSIGDDSALSSSTALAMQTVGLSHLTAVSGANCAIVIALAYLLLKKLALNRWMRAAAASAVLVAYVMLVGPEPSVLRSSFMATVVLVVVAAGRASAAASALALAVLLLLIISPQLATNAGFALSVFATLGILVLAPRIHQLLSERIPSWLSLPVAVSLSAQVACWPILLQIQDGVSTYSLMANLVAEPFVAPVTILGLIACLVAVPLPALASLIAWVASFFAWPIAWIANALNELPVNTLSWPKGLLGTGLAVGVVLAIVAALLAENHRKRLISAGTLLIVAAVFIGTNTSSVIRSGTWMKSDWDIVNCDVGQGDAMLIRSGGAVALIDVGKHDRAIDDCLTALKIEIIDLLVLTHYDIDHVGGLAGAIGGRQVGVALLTEFEDIRPAKSASIDLLKGHGIATTTAHTGLTGQLGAVSWRVLTPNAGAREAEDSNDASTTMLFEGSEFRLLATADLGERGQMRLSRVLGDWVGDQRPLILKVSHHGSADQYPELIEYLKPTLSVISVGASNSYGHPTDRTIRLLQRVGSAILRTDELGSIAIDTFQASASQISFEIEASG